MEPPLRRLAVPSSSRKRRSDGQEPRAMPSDPCRLHRPRPPPRSSRTRETAKRRRAGSSRVTARALDVAKLAEDAAAAVVAVTFVGTLSGGSSYSSTSAPAPRASAPKPTAAAADGVGISVLDDEDGQLHDGFHALQVQEQWPPVVTSVMGPMSLPVARPPEPKHTGAMFHDPEGQSVLPEDALVFIQFPTTLPLANAVATLPKGKEDVEMRDAEDESAPLSAEDARRSKLAVKEEKTALQSQPHDNKSEEPADETSARSLADELYDRSIATAPGGFIGKLCIRRSGKTVLMIGDKQFDVAAAQTPSFCEEVYSIDTAEKQLYMLGSVERHLVVTPDFDALLS
ncbi:hypothetical protein PybrP1_007014 [[Pythium] brassicae (nom. inval.)]|nr:hypothetical protein PybrP1_007014 [[Pythium] brassicae (nom. inval.)]